MELLAWPDAMVLDMQMLRGRQGAGRGRKMPERVLVKE
jgi:hypothetical protein